jgi:hypothetical protein
VPADWRTRTVLLAVVLAVIPAATGSGCAPGPPPTSSGSTPAAARGAPARSVIIVDADPHGAVLLDGQGAY